MFKRKKTHEVKIRDASIGGSNPIRVQSMTSTKTEDIDATLNEIERLVKAGAELVRVAIPHKRALLGFKKIRRNTQIPLIADIHFNYKLAIEAMEAGADKVRINPGNIGGEGKVKRIIEAAKINGVPIRIGVNSGSLEVDLIDKYGGVTPDALVESALRWIRFFEREGFFEIVVSVKSSSVPQTISAYRKLSAQTDHPLHLGVTEAGTLLVGSIKSSIGIGSLLVDGIGDTIRVSLTTDPVEEVRVAWEILKALELRSRGPMIISCPTCGRVKIDLYSIVNQVEEILSSEEVPIKVAIMGCEVNGPGEARDADVGIAAGAGFGLIFRKGKIVRRVPETELVEELLKEIEIFKKDRLRLLKNEGEG